MPQIGWQFPGLLSKAKKMEKNVSGPELCSGFSLRDRRVVELNDPAEALDGGCEAYGTAQRLSTALTRPWLASIATLHMLFKLQVWSDEYLSNKYKDPR